MLALAVNLGITKASDLTMVSRDVEMNALMKKLVHDNILTTEEAIHLRPFYNQKYVPMDPIYCIITPVNTTYTPDSIIGDDEAITGSADGDMSVEGDDIAAINHDDVNPSTSSSIYLYLSMVINNVNSTLYSADPNTNQLIFKRALSDLFNHTIPGSKFSKIHVSNITIDSTSSYIYKEDLTLSFWVGYSFGGQAISESAAAAQVLTRLQSHTSTFLNRLKADGTKGVSAFLGNAKLSSSNIFFYYYIDPANAAAAAASGANAYSYDDAYSYSPNLNEVSCDCDFYIENKYSCGSKLCTCSNLQANYGLSCSTGCNCFPPDTCSNKNTFGATCATVLDRWNLKNINACPDSTGNNTYPCTCTILNWYGENLGLSEPACSGCNKKLCPADEKLPSTFDSCKKAYYDQNFNLVTCTSLNETVKLNIECLEYFGFDCTGCRGFTQASYANFDVSSCLASTPGLPTGYYSPSGSRRLEDGSFLDEGLDLDEYLEGVDVDHPVGLFDPDRRDAVLRNIYAETNKYKDEKQFDDERIMPSHPFSTMKTVAVHELTGMSLADALVILAPVKELHTARRLSNAAKPITKVDSFDKAVCYVRLGETFALPVISSYGATGVSRQKTLSDPLGKT